MAQSLLQRLRVPEDLFPSAGPRSLYRDARQAISAAEPATPAHVLEEAFGSLLAALDSLPDRDSTSIEQELLREAGADGRSEVASRQRLEVSGHDAVLVETWLRLTHEKQGRYLLLLERGYAIGAWTGRGAFVSTGPVFDVVRRSLRIERAAADTSAAATPVSAAPAPRPVSSRSPA